MIFFAGQSHYRAHFLKRIADSWTGEVVFYTLSHLVPSIPGLRPGRRGFFECMGPRFGSTRRHHFLPRRINTSCRLSSPRCSSLTAYGRLFPLASDFEPLKPARIFIRCCYSLEIFVPCVVFRLFLEKFRGPSLFLPFVEVIFTSFLGFVCI